MNSNRDEYGRITHIPDDEFKIHYSKPDGYHYELTPAFSKIPMQKLIEAVQDLRERLLELELTKQEMDL